MKFSCLCIAPHALSLFALTGIAFPATAQNLDGYELGVLPFQAPARISKVFAPVASELAGILGKPVRLRSSATLSSFKDGLNRG